MQDNISFLSVNVSNQIRHINTTLTTKADQHNVDMLIENVTILSVTVATFKALEDTVQALRTSKANQTSLDQLEATVNQLDDATVKQQALHSLGEKVSDHISSSQQTHDQHGSRISDNGRKIQSNTDRINSVEDEIQDLKTDSNSGLTASRISVISSTTLFLVLVSVCAY
jgi:chromosome segregation ATPase